MPPAADQFDRYCKACRHSLRGLTSNTCPECGRGFDPSDPGTTLAHWRARSVLSLAALGRVLTIACAFVTTALFVTSANGAIWRYGVLTLFIATFLIWAACYVVAFVIACVPAVPLSRRTRIAGLTLPLLAGSIIAFGWPMRLSFLAHRPWLNDLATGAARGENIQVPTRVGLFHVVKVDVGSNGDVRILASGDAAGGVCFIRAATPRKGRWALDDEWFYFIED